MVVKSQQIKAPSAYQEQLYSLEKKERQSYEALAAVVDFIKGIKKSETIKKDDFYRFKKTVIQSVEELGLQLKPKVSRLGPKFNVKHYERAILQASEVTYRDMAIQAAYKDLTKEALWDLVMALRKNCCQTSRQLKELMQEMRKENLIVRGKKRQLWQNVVEPSP